MIKEEIAAGYFSYPLVQVEGRQGYGMLNY
jgi:hypothetical protein